MKAFIATILWASLCAAAIISTEAEATGATSPQPPAKIASDAARQLQSNAATRFTVREREKQLRKQQNGLTKEELEKHEKDQQQKLRASQKDEEENGGK